MNKAEASVEIESIKAQLIEKYRPEKIILFGSAAGEEMQVRDIDLFIIKKDVPHYGDERAREVYKLIEANIAVDYLIYKPEEVEERRSLGDPFVKKILEEGKLIYG